LRQQISKWLSILLPLLLGFFLIVYTYQKYTPEQIETIKGYFRHADYFYIFISLIISTLGCASRAYRWKYSLEYMGYKNSFANNFFAVCIGYLMNTTIPRSGELSRAVIVKKYDGIPFDKGFGTIVAERVVDMIVLFFLAILALFVQFDVVKAFVLDKIPVEKAMIVLIVGTVMTIAAVLVYFYSKIGIVLMLKEKISGLKEGMLSIVKMEKKWPFIFHTIFIWVTYILMFYVTIFALPETSGISFGAILTSFIVGSMVIAITSSGFGTYPVLMAKILVFYSIAEPVGTAFGWIVWTSQILLIVVSGLVSFILLPLFNRTK
jgi:uncharacterized protein (TIRG00374 family)